MDDLKEWFDQLSSSSSSSFPLLKVLVISNCPKLTLMPNRFPSLKTLYLQKCNTPIGSLVESNWSFLTSISIIDCQGLVSLPMGLLRGNNILFRLEIRNCKKFQGFPPPNIDLEDGVRENLFPNQVFPSNSIKELSLINCGLLNFCIDFQEFHSLRKLSIVYCKTQESISCSGIEFLIRKKSGIEYLPKLESLEIGSTSDELDSFPFPDANIEGGTTLGNYFPSLRELNLHGWSKLKSIPDQIQYITCLRTLGIKHVSLVALPEWLGNMASLTGLHILNCRHLRYLPSQEQMLRLTSLQTLLFYRSEVLEDRCKAGGEEAYKISPEPHLITETVYLFCDS
ncbi:hypothetical protein MKW92_003463 [Papaver armeniacum]|nr:hypothetical protein MKW92_003463 [Papaver armeniacum]